jgi:hypothetical protein
LTVAAAAYFLGTLPFRIVRYMEFHSVVPLASSNYVKKISCGIYAEMRAKFIERASQRRQFSSPQSETKAALEG